MGSSPLSSLLLEYFIIPSLLKKVFTNERSKVTATEGKSFKVFDLISKKKKKEHQVQNQEIWDPELIAKNSVNLNPIYLIFKAIKVNET